jgi:hypothetical protein
MRFDCATAANNEQTVGAPRIHTEHPKSERWSLNGKYGSLSEPAPSSAFARHFQKGTIWSTFGKHDVGHVLLWNVGPFSKRVPLRALWEMEFQRIRYGVMQTLEHFQKGFTWFPFGNTFHNVSPCKYSVVRLGLTVGGTTVLTLPYLLL